MIWTFILEHLGPITVTAIIGAAWAVYTQIDKKRVKLRITQSGSDITNRVYATELDMTGYRAEVKIINDSSFPVVLCGLDLQLPWNDEDFRFLPDPREGRHRREYYEMPTTSSLRWSMADVINHRTFTNGKMEPGDVIEGFILAVGTTPIPAFYHHGDEIEMKFSAYDQRSKPHSIRLTFWVDVLARRFMSVPELAEDSDPEGEEKQERKLASAKTAKKQIKVLVIGTDHNIQRRQDTNPDLGPKRDQFERLVRQIIKEKKIALVAEEAGDDKQLLEKLKRSDEEAAEFERQLRQMMEKEGQVSKGAGLFGGTKAADDPISSIAKKIADDSGVRYEDVDVDIRVVNEDDLDSIKKRSDAITEEILSVIDDADRVVVIVGELHREDVAQRLRHEGMYVEYMHYPMK